MAANFIRYNSAFLYAYFRGRYIGVHPGGGEIFPTRPDRPWDPPSLLATGYGVFPGVGGGDRLVRGVDHPPHIAPRSKKEWSYTATPPLGLRGLFQGELYVYLLPLYRGADYIV
jgi:hypothetical protein